MKTTITTDAEFLAISVVEAKQWCRIDTSADDALLEGLIRAATQAVEAFTDRTITPATVEFAIAGSCIKAITLPTAPISPAVQVELEDAQGNRTVLVAGADFRVRGYDIGTTIILYRALSGLCALIVTAEAGYASPDAIPQGIKQAIAIHVGSAYADREGQDTAQSTFANLLRPHCVGGI